MPQLIMLPQIPNSLLLTLLGSGTRQSESHALALGI